MKFLSKTIFLLTLVLLLSCSSDDDSTSNSFRVNGITYATNFAYSTTGGSGSPIEVLIFSSADRYLDTYVENRGRFDLRYSGDQLTPGEYTESAVGIVEFTKDIQKEDGSFVSLGEDLAFASSGTNSFRNATIVVNSVTYDSQGDITQIDIEYRFTWDAIQVSGSYSGDVRIDP